MKKKVRNSLKKAQGHKDAVAIESEESFFEKIRKERERSVEEIRTAQNSGSRGIENWQIRNQRNVNVGVVGHSSGGGSFEEMRDAWLAQIKMAKTWQREEAKAWGEDVLHKRKLAELIFIEQQLWNHHLLRKRVAMARGTNRELFELHLSRTASYFEATNRRLSELTGKALIEGDEAFFFFMAWLARFRHDLVSNRRGVPASKRVKWQMSAPLTRIAWAAHRLAGLSKGVPNSGSARDPSVALPVPAVREIMVAMEQLSRSHKTYGMTKNTLRKHLKALNVSVDSQHGPRKGTPRSASPILGRKFDPIEKRLRKLEKKAARS